MKKIEFDIVPHAIDTFFPKERVKTKLQLLVILLEATRYMLVYPEMKNIVKKGKVTLAIDKMSRLFFEKDEKYYSIVFPFNTYKNGNKLNFTFQNIDVDSQLISNVISTIKCDSFQNRCSLDFADAMFDFESELEDFWVFLRELILIEDGYIRFDKDIEGYNRAKAKGKEHRHPANHYDLYYSNKASFKVGLENEIVMSDFIDLLDIKTDCKYLKNWR